ncbi:MAG: hypothetical protein AAFN10_09490 [Bacteroidota bacterium]
MKARFCILLLFFMALVLACQSESQSQPSHAAEVIEKHRVKDSIRTLELIQSLQQDSLKGDSTALIEN